MWGVSTQFQAVAGGSKTLPGPLKGPPKPPGASRGLRGVQGPQTPFSTKNAPAAYRQSLEPWARLKFHAGWSGWTRPPTMAGRGRGGQVQGPEAELNEILKALSVSKVRLGQA